jgi:hypothetical protein
MNKMMTLAAFAAWSLSASSVLAADPANVCEAGKVKASGAYSACRLKVDSGVAIKGGVPDYSKCLGKFNDKFPATETKAGVGICPTEGDVAPIRTFIEACDDTIADALAGGALPLDVTTCNSDLTTCDADLAACSASTDCGNGLIDAPESCDGANLDGKTCANFGSVDFTGLACSSNCEFDMTGCAFNAPAPSRFVDNGDQTATDLWTGRTWEMKTGVAGPFVLCPNLASCPNVHDVNNDYYWTAVGLGTAFDGSVKTAFLDVLNDVAGGGASCFAGHCDWRLPTALEIKGILLEPDTLTCATTPCVDASFPGPTGPGGYWSSNTRSDNTTRAFYTRFDSGGGVVDAQKTAPRYARAIRGGL